MTSNYCVIVSAAHSLSSLYIPSHCTRSFGQVHADEDEEEQDEEYEQLGSDAAALLATTSGGEPAEQVEDA